MNRKQPMAICLVSASLVLLILAPLILPEIQIHMAVEILIFSLFAVSYNLMLGFCGLSPLGHAAFFGTGGYVAALMLTHLPSLPLVSVLAVASLSGLLTAIVIGFFCVRASGNYFTLLSFSFQMFLFAVALKWREVTNGDDGMGVRRPDLYVPGLGKLSLMNICNTYYFTLTCAGLGILACYFFLKTPLGNAVVCMRENETRATFLGYNAFFTKLVAFSFSGLLAALAGGLFVLFQEFVATSVIDVSMSFTIILMTVLGGTGNFLGPILGSAFYLIIQNWLSSLTSNWFLFVGILFIVVVLFMPSGLIGFFQRRKKTSFAETWRK